MPTTDTNLAERSGSLVESHKGYDPRVVFFYFILAALLLTLVGGLAWQQLFRTRVHDLAAQLQNQRRILVPGPRGNIYARDGFTVLVGNRPRFGVVLYLDELKGELRREHIRIHQNYLDAGEKKDVPTYAQLEQLARVSVVQRYLDQVDAILHRESEVDSRKLQQHFDRQLLLPYTLIDDLAPEDYARLIERLPVRSPLQVYTSSTRFYPFGSAAAHTLGYIGSTDDVEADDFPGEGLKTFKMKGSVGKSGLEQRYDELLQGEAGGMIYRVDPAGYKINPPLEKRLPVQGKNLVTSLDIDLQLAAEEALAPHDSPDDAVTGAAVALDVATGEVLVLASKPDYDLNQFSPHATQAVMDDMNARGAWNNLALNGLYPPGSTFKLVVSIAGLRHGTLQPEDDSVDCEGTIRIGNSRKGCDNGIGHHGHLTLPDAIAASCDIYFYEHGIAIGPNAIAEEARRFHLDQPTGIELPDEQTRMIIPDPAWERKNRNEPWTDGDTANTAIGQGFVRLTPLDMACFVASLARGETTTKPTLVHQPDRPAQHTESIGLTPEQRAIVLDGMARVVTNPLGTAYKYFRIPGNSIPGVSIAGKTGTAQYGNKLNVAWFICFAPLENPEIAVVAAVRSGAPNEGYAGGWDGARIVGPILKKYFEKKNRSDSATLSPFKVK